MRIKIVTFLFICLTSEIYAQNTLSYTQVESFYNNGIELFEKKTYAAARKELHEYIDKSEKSINPNKFNIANAEYYAALSALYSHSKDADVEVSRFVIKNPDHPKAHLIFSDFAKSFFDRGDYENAIKYYKKGLENRADNLDTYEQHYFLGVSYYMSNDYKSALSEFNYIKNTSAPNAINAAYYAGVINFKNENYDLALADLIRVENVNPYKMEVPNWIGQIYYKQKRNQELIAYSEPIIANPNGRKIDDLCLITAEVFFFDNNFEKAAYYYDKFKNFRRGTVSEQISFRHAYSLYKTGKYQSAATIFKTLASQNTAIGQQSAYYLGISSVKNNDLKTAESAFSFAKRLDFDTNIKEEAYYNYVKVLVENNNNPKAITEIQNYIKENSNGKYVDESNEILSEIFYETNNYVSAINYIEGLKRKTPKIETAYQKLCFNQGVVDYNSERFENALSYFNKAISQPKDANINTKAKFWKAESSYQLGKPETEELYHDLITSTDLNIKLKSLYNLGYLSFNNKNYPKANGYFTDFLERAKSSSELSQYKEDALVRIGDCALINRDFNDALRIYSQAYTNNNTDKDYALYQKGITQKYLNQDAEAQKTFDLFVKNYGNSRLLDDALFQNASIEMDKNNYSKAAGILTDLISKKPNSVLVPEALLKRALAYSNLQQNEKAITDYKLILNKYNNSAFADEALLGIKDALNSQNRSDEFFEIAEQFKKTNPGSNSVVNLQFDAAKDLYYAEKYEKAIAAFKNYLNVYPSNANSGEANFLIAESYYILNNKSEALSYYKTVISSNQTEFITKSAARSAAIEYDTQNFDKAIVDYQEVVSTSSNQREIILAKEGIYKSNYYLGNYDKTISFCNQVISEGAGTVIDAENRAKLFIAKAMMQKKEFNGAKEAFNNVVKMGNDVNSAEAVYYIGEIQYKLKDYDTSIKTLQDLAQNYSEFTYWYEKGFLLIADVYVAKNDTFMAKATLNSIIDNSENKATIETAKQKLKSIK